MGHVNGALTIGTTPYNWQALPYKKPTASGITTGKISWATTNPYGKAVTLDLVSAPASPILVTKYMGRIGGSGSENEVFNPVVYFRAPAAKAEYRVTALLSRYGTEAAKTATEIPVTGTGHALKVNSLSSEDTIYTGDGISSFGGYTTDAETVYIRKLGNDMEYTLIRGTFLSEGNISRINITRKVDLLTLKQEGKIIKFRISGQNSADIRMEQTVADSVVRDGAAYSNWIMEDKSTTLKISTTLSEHDFVVSTGNYLSIEHISNQTVNVTGQLQFRVNVTYTGTGSLQSGVSNLPKNALFNTSSRVFSWKPSANQTGNYTVTFNVTDGRLSDSMDVLIRVTAGNRAPVLDPIGNRTVNVTSPIRFAVNATDPDGDALSYSASGLPVNSSFDPVNRTFTWAPYTSQAGNYTVIFNVTDGRLFDTENVLIR